MSPLRECSTIKHHSSASVREPSFIPLGDESSRGGRQAPPSGDRKGCTIPHTHSRSPGHCALEHGASQSTTGRIVPPSFILQSLPPPHPHPTPTLGVQSSREDPLSGRSSHRVLSPGSPSDRARREASLRVKSQREDHPGERETPVGAPSLGAPLLRTRGWGRTVPRRPIPSSGRLVTVLCGPHPPDTCDGFFLRREHSFPRADRVSPARPSQLLWRPRLPPGVVTSPRPPRAPRLARRRHPGGQP